jgi:hypothetical protein
LRWNSHTSWPLGKQSHTCEYDVWDLNSYEMNTHIIPIWVYVCMLANYSCVELCMAAWAELLKVARKILPEMWKKQADVSRWNVAASEPGPKDRLERLGFALGPRL